MNQNKFGTDEAVQYVLDTGSESELSELEKSDFEENTDITIQVLPRIREIEEEQSKRKQKKRKKRNTLLLIMSKIQNGCRKGVKNRKYKYRRRSTNPLETNTTFMRKAFSMSTVDVDTFTPLNYFHFFQERIFAWGYD